MPFHPQMEQNAAVTEQLAKTTARAASQPGATVVIGDFTIV